MHIVLIILAVIVLMMAVNLPNLWVNQVMEKYRSPDNLFPGTGAELVSHLADHYKFANIEVEKTNPGEDHYDPVAEKVRLSPHNFDGKSLTAITVAAHEFGHALQHQTGYPMFRLRHSLARFAYFSEKIGTGTIIGMPFFALISGSPTVAGLIILIGIAGIALGTLVHAVTLPVEWDASFNRALPILEKGKYIDEYQSYHARKILKAAALTYVAASLASLFNLYRWIVILRR